MTDTSTGTTGETAAKIIANAEIAAKSFSTYVVIAASWAAAIWVGLPTEEQTALLGKYPALIKGGPYLTFAAWAVLRVAPQWITTHAERQKVRFDAWVAELRSLWVAGRLPKVIVAPAGVDPALVASAVAGLDSPAPATQPPVDISLPMPGSARMPPQPDAAAAPSAATQPPQALLGVRSRLAAEHPDWTPAQLDVAVTVATAVRP